MLYDEKLSLPVLLQLSLRAIMPISTVKDERLNPILPIVDPSEILFYPVQVLEKMLTRNVGECSSSFLLFELAIGLG